MDTIKIKRSMKDDIQDTGGRLPTFIIIGAMKSGTSSLHYWLKKHPEIFMSRTKEVNYFNDPFYEQRDLTWYRSHFKTDKKVIGESSTGYSKFPSGGPVNEHLHAALPDLKLIYIVRDPIRRIYSHFVHAVIDDIREPDLEVFYRQLNPKAHVINCSRYYYQLQRYLKYYPLKRIKVICFEDMLQSREKTLREVYQFLGVDEKYQCSLDDKGSNAAVKQYKRYLDAQRGFAAEKNLEKYAAVKDILTKNFAEIVLLQKIPQETLELLQQDAHDLRQLTGNTFSEWLL